MKNLRKKDDVVVICAYCKKVLDGREDNFIEDPGTMVSHGICPNCLLLHFPKEYVAIQKEQRIRIKTVFKKR